MMSAYANSLRKPERFGLYLKKFRAICVMHGVQVGSQKDLRDFMEKLKEDRHLAMDFWALIGKLSNREGGELSDDQVLGIVVEGVTGGDVPEDDGEMKRTVDDLRALLAGVDVHASAHSHVEPKPFPRTDPAPWRAEAEAGIHAVELPLRASSSRAGFMFEASQREGGRTASPVTPQLNEEVLRAELARLVKEYFENVEGNNSENRLNGVASMGNVANAATPRSLEPHENRRRQEMEDPPLMSYGSSRLVLEPTGPLMDERFEAEKHDPLEHVPLEYYAKSEGYGRFIVVMIVILVLLESMFLGYRYRVPLRKSFNAQINKIEDKFLAEFGKGAPPPSTSETSTSEPSNGEASTDEVPTSRASTSEPPRSEAPTKRGSTEPAKPSQPFAEASPFRGVSTPAPANVGTGVGNTTKPARIENAPTPARPNETRVAQGASDPKGSNPNGGNRRATNDRAPSVQADQEPSDGISLSDLAGAVYVAPGVMDSNLVASRVPAYPDGAKADGIEGSVTMQAVISTDGRVKRIHVVKGDSRLRNAAMEAVYKWQYRPYRLNGRPVDVWTTVTVDFDLDR